MTLKFFLDLKSLCRVNMSQIGLYFEESFKILEASNLRHDTDKQFVEELFVRNNDDIVSDFNHKSKKPLYEAIFSQPSSEITNRLIPSVLCRFSPLDEEYINLINYGVDEDNAEILYPNAKVTAEVNPLRLWHISTLDHYKNFREYHIKEKILSSSCDKDTFKVYLPKMILTAKSLESFRTLSNDDKELILRDLIKLNEYVSKNWLQGNFQVLDFAKTTGVDASDESDTTKNDPKLKRKRLFSIPDIGSEYCFLHIKISNTYRIHFYPDKQTHNIYIPYIGAHLKTARNR